MKNVRFIALVVAGCLASTAANAATQTVTNLNSPLPAGTSWGTVPGENTGTVAITSAAARSGNGSIELTGNRTRVQTGYQYSLPIPPTNIAQLSSVQSLTFDWQVAADSSNTTYTPALRLLVQNATGTGRSELIWEGAYQPGLNGAASAAQNTAGNWYSTSSTDRFWQFVGDNGSGVSNGPTYQAGTQTYVFHTIAEWAAILSGTANGGTDNGSFVSGVSVGAGGGAGAAYHAFADNVAFTTTAGTTTYNFEVASVASPAPEPATWAMMIAGFGMAGFALRRSGRRSVRAVA